MRSTSNRIAAIFDSPGKAENAVRELHAAGFRGDQIGCNFANYDDMDPDQRSMWEKIKDFFGDEEYSDRETKRGYVIPERFRSRLEGGRCLITVWAEDRVPQAEQILTSYGGAIDRDFALEEAKTGDIEGQRIQLLSEVLRVNKERVQTGEVRLRKDVITERQNIEVPVTREELVIERKPGDQRPVSGKLGADQEIRVPLSEERVNVEKRPVVSEEVQVGKKKVQDTRTVSEDVKREELAVDKEGDINVDEPRKRKTA